MGDGVRLAPVYSDVIVRDPVTLEPVPDGEAGLLEFITPLPHSYPGIALLVDDMGRIVSRDQGQDGRYGTRFEVLGRAQGCRNSRLRRHAAGADLPGAERTRRRMKIFVLFDERGRAYRTDGRSGNAARWKRTQSG